MLNIEIPTNVDTHLVDHDEPGKVLAGLLRKVADRIESDIRIMPGNPHEWTPEVYREAGRFEGVLVGATITLQHDQQPPPAPSPYDPLDEQKHRFYEEN